MTFELPSNEIVSHWEKEIESLRALNAELREALKEFDEYAWSAVTVDCVEAADNLQGKVNKARAILAKSQEAAP
jgi:type II secretory pathway component PulM